MSRSVALAALHVAVLLFGFAGSVRQVARRSRPVAIVLGRTAVAAAALGILQLRVGQRAAAVRARASSPTARCSRCTGWLLRRDPGLERGDRAARLRELSAVRAGARARCCSAPCAAADARRRVARWSSGLVLLVPEFSWPNRPCRDSRGAACRASRSRCSPCSIAASRAARRRCRHRVLAERRAPRCACCRSRGPARAALRPSARARSRCWSCSASVCTALAHTLFIAALRARDRAHGERGRGARAGVRHRAALLVVAAARCLGARDDRRRRADRAPRRRSIAAR